MLLKDIINMEDEAFIQEVLEAGKGNKGEAFNTDDPIEKQLKDFEGFSQTDKDYTAMIADAKKII